MRPEQARIVAQARHALDVVQSGKYCLEPPIRLVHEALYARHDAEILIAFKQPIRFINEREYSP